MIIQPINNRFKRLINDFGNEWVVIGNPRPMICFNGETGVTCSPISNSNKVSNFRASDTEMFVAKQLDKLY